MIPSNNCVYFPSSSESLVNRARASENRSCRSCSRACSNLSRDLLVNVDWALCEIIHSAFDQHKVNSVHTFSEIPALVSSSFRIPHRSRWFLVVQSLPKGHTHQQPQPHLHPPLAYLLNSKFLIRFHSDLPRFLMRLLANKRDLTHITNISLNDHTIKRIGANHLVHFIGNFLVIEWSRHLATG